MKTEQPVLRDIVLVGGGHSHVMVLRMLGMKPIPGVRLTVICTDNDTPYSGMLPGYIAGHYSFDDVHIDLGKLCAFAGARFYQSRVTGIDRTNRKVFCDNRPPVAYDVLSINIGSTPQVSHIDGAQNHVTPVKPIGKFNDKWTGLLNRARSTDGPLTIAIVGGGAGGVELALSMQHRLTNEWTEQGKDTQKLHFHLFTSGDLLPTHNSKVRQKFLDTLNSRGIHIHQGDKVVKVSENSLTNEQGKQFLADEIMWVTHAGGAPWLRDTGLELDKHGFIQVRDTLQSTTDDLIFAAGDISSMVNFPLEKAGVFAVRMGKPLANNLRRLIAGEALHAYQPQSTWLALISTGNKYAVASKGKLGFWGSWVWAWKDWIDQRFMAKFRDLPEMNPEAISTTAQASVALTQDESLQAISAIAMRCGGCGAKVGSDILSRALASLQVVEHPDVVVGLNAPDDAAIVKVPSGHMAVHTIDFFRAFIDDPYTFGKIAANHALGDIFAMGAKPHSCTAVVTIPPGLESKQEELLFQLMTGAVEVLNEAACPLVGGHTGEGKELALGFAINGLVKENLEGAMTKGGLKAGDVLILTKPMGTGTLFAALPQAKAKGRWIQAALRNMMQTNFKAADILANHGAKACTDLTGFGLLGHLVEMTKASDVDASLWLDQIPLLGGARECVAMGIVSSLQPANVRLRRAIRNQAQWVDHPLYPLLFDPQTAGGLLASVPANQAQTCLAELKNAGYIQANIIGQIHQTGEAIEPIVLENK